ncbi:proton-coupled amino acid transporter-like protein CG1139 [Anopheles aquasalis]|uniref:proton-coupled amino acid transporter-like protein CG1139 n=1 Tax=Anopheles aquasalis TaxID=42839 RepID=UPI00215A40CE|nr:proton-coupled amino acid transporter-like protein CG1139 [Anopheles aquasalis]
MMQEMSQSELKAERKRAKSRTVRPPQPVFDENGYQAIDLHVVEYGDSRTIDNVDLERGDGAQGQQAGNQAGYTGTLMNYCKGNIGTGCYAMGEAFRNGGLLMGPLLTIVIGLISLHCQHIVLECTELMEAKLAEERAKRGHSAIEERQLTFAETVGYCFQYGPERFRPWANTMRHTVNVFTCVTQLGFCCIYYVFIGSSMKQIADYCGMHLPTGTHLALLLILLIPLCLITKLNRLTPFSAVANVLMGLGVAVCFYYALKDPLPDGALTERALVAEPDRIPPFFSTVIFAFEGVSLVLPLKNGMRRPQDFGRTSGVLNVGTAFIVVLYVALGFVGYLRWGDEVQGSMTLNLPDGELLAETVKLCIASGVLLGFALQLYIAVEVLWPLVQRYLPIVNKQPTICEMILRTLLVLMISFIGTFVPHLGLFISLMGALCSTVMGLIFPAIISLIVAYSNPNVRPGGWLLAKNIGILLLGVVGFACGTYVSIRQIMN